MWEDGELQRAHFSHIRILLLEAKSRTCEEGFLLRALCRRVFEAVRLRKRSRLSADGRQKKLEPRVSSSSFLLLSIIKSSTKITVPVSFHVQTVSFKLFGIFVHHKDSRSSCSAAKISGKSNPHAEGFRAGSKLHISTPAG